MDYQRFIDDESSNSRSMGTHSTLLQRPAKVQPFLSKVRKGPKLPSCTQCENIPFFTSVYQDPLDLVVVYKGLYIQGSSTRIANVK